MRYLLIGTLVFLCLGISLAPAGLITGFTEDRSDISLQRSRGTVWQGQADLLTQGRMVGVLRWSIHPLSLFTLKLDSDWQLDQTFAQLAGSATIDNNLYASADGQVQSGAVNEWVGQYDIHLDGQFTLSAVETILNIEEQRLDDLDGTITWSGGLVRFTLSGLLHEEYLPPMLASLMMVDGLPRAVIVAQGESTPLMIVQPGHAGYIKIGITKHFTRLLNRPWPGNHPDHTIVLEVEEKIY